MAQMEGESVDDEVQPVPRPAKRLNAKMAAERLGVSVSLVYQLCHERRLPHLRLGKAGRRGKIQIEERDLDAFLAAARIEVGAADATAPLKHITLQ